MDVIIPEWPAPSNIRAVSTKRAGGVSSGIYESLNLGAHVGDQTEHVLENRARVRSNLNLPSEPIWLDQVHGNRAIQAQNGPIQQADASLTREHGVICCVMTADCLPILVCSKDGASVSAIHAGWRGILNGVTQNAVKEMDSTALIAWLGPAIGPDVFEVGHDVYASFTHQSKDFMPAFRQKSDDRWLANIYMLGRIVLNRSGIEQIYGGQWCTFTQKSDFFSFRRDHQTGRMATLIWREKE